jgi:predicted N-acetyltransferase YhbS
MAFGDRDDESRLVKKIRLSEQFIPQLSIVAEEKEDIVGHLLLSKAKVVNGENEDEVIVLAPIAVKPDFQKSGIGKRLM